MDTYPLERMFGMFSLHSGLFLIGAGASAGWAPLGKVFWSGPQWEYVSKFNSIPVHPSPREPLTQRMIDFSDPNAGEPVPGRHIRQGREDLLIDAIRRRMPNGYARAKLMHSLAKPRYLVQTEGRITDSYRVFRAFAPSVVADYNHDGLAQEFGGNNHQVVEMHGAIDALYGSPETARWVTKLMEFDISLPSDDLIMGLPEVWTDLALHRRLKNVLSCVPRYVAIIGYSFAQMGESYDDAVSLACFVQKFKHYPGPIFVIAPEPTSLCEMLSEALQIRTVFSVSRYWNVLAHAYLECIRQHKNYPSVNYAHELFCDQFGINQVFPVSA